MSPKGRGQAETVQRERCVPASVSLGINPVFLPAQAIALRIHSYCKTVLAVPQEQRKKALMVCGTGTLTQVHHRKVLYCYKYPGYRK